MALNANALCDFAYIQSLAPGTLPTNQAQVEALINTASSEIENICRRKLASQTFTSFLTYSDNRTILPALNLYFNFFSSPNNGNYKALALGEYPIIGTPQVFADSSYVFGAGTQITDFVVDTDYGILYFPSSVLLPTTPNAIKVTYQAGYSPVPEPLKMACYESVAWYLKRINSNSAGAKDSNKDGLTTNYEIGIPIHALKLIAPYKDPC